MKKKALWILLLMMMCINTGLFAVVAYPYPLDFVQSDRSTVTVVLKGDEKVSWAKSTDGYTLMRADNGDFVYAISDGKGGMMPSNVISHNPENRTAEETAFVSTLDKALFYSPEQISYLKQLWLAVDDFEAKRVGAKSGVNEIETYKMVVILMSYADVAFESSREEVDALFNQVGYSVNGHQGSIHDYFKASSAGKLNVEATVLGPYTAANDLNYYGENYPGTNADMRARDLVIEAVEHANLELDFSEFTNGEGNQVSCVYVIYAGPSAASGGAANTIWPHRSHLLEPYAVDGVYVYNYGVSSENGGSQYNPQPMTIGTICHEFSHVLGQADYYDTDYEEQGSFADHGEWDLMCSGNYNNGGKCPPLWSAHERTVRGYIEIEELLEEGSTTLPPLHSDNKAYKMTVSSDEFFILENRQKVGWDYYLPGHGMLIFHVNKSVTGWNHNCANCIPTSPGLDLEEANSNPYSRAGNPFPGTSNKTIFTDTSTPNSKTVSGANLNRPITSIAENTTTKNITFIYGTVDNTRPVVTTVSAEGFSDSISVVASVNNGQGLSIVERGVCFSDTTSIPTIACNTVVASGTADNFTVGLNALMPNTEYYVRAYAKTADKVGYGEIMKIKTACSAIDVVPFEESFEEGITSFDCWGHEYGVFVSNNWSLTDSAYEAGGIATAAEGSKWAFIRSDWNGTQTTKLVTVPMDLSAISDAKLKFSYAQKAKSGRQDNLKVYYKTSSNDSWTLLSSYTSNTSTWTEVTIDLPEASENYYLAFEAVLKGGYGVCLDNIEVYEADVAAFPNVRTISFDNLTDISFDISSELLSNGSNAVYELGVCYATHAMPTIADHVLNAPLTDQYVLTLSSLEPNTTYYVRAFAKNTGHLAYGEELQITTKCERISTYPYDVLGTECVETGSWNYSSEAQSYTFTSSVVASKDMLVLPLFNLQNFEGTAICFDRKQPSTSTSAIDTLKVLYKSAVNQAWETLATFSTATNDFTRDSIPLIGLSNEYFLAFEATSNLSSIELKNIVVRAILQTPLVQTGVPTLSSYNSISVSGEVTYGGLSDVTARGVCWSLESTPTISDNVISLGSGLGEFSGTMNNLSENTSYYIRAFATNSYGTAYGEEYMVTTPYTPIFNNTISGDQDVCEGVVANTLIGSTPTGGDGSTYTYQWIMSTDSITWTESTMSSLSTGKDLEMRQLFSTTYFRRVVYSTMVSDTSNVVTITISPTTKGGNVFLVSEDPRSGQELRLQLRAYTGEILYWEKRKAEFNWETIENSQDSVYLTDIPSQDGLWDYRAVVQSGTCDSKTSGYLTVNVALGVGLDRVEFDQNSIKLIPNPSDGNICLQSTSDLANVKVEIISLNGKVMSELNNVSIRSGENKFDFTHLRAGSYVIRLSSDKIAWETIMIINN